MNETSAPAKPENMLHWQVWTKTCLAILMIIITAGQTTSPSLMPLLTAQPLAATSPCTFPPFGLVGWWPGDGNARDIVGPNHGTLVNGASFAPGKVGQAFSLNGVNQYVNVGSSTTFNVLNFTIDAWAQIDPAANVGERRIISRDDVVVVPDSSRQLFVLKSSSPSASGGANGHAVFGILKSGVLSQVSAPGSLTAGWHHLAGVRSGSTISLYVDGVLAANTTTSITGTISPLAPLVIGQASPALNSEFFLGSIDEVEIFDRALSASEIQAIFTADTAGKCKPVAYWMFDEGAGSTAYDESGNGNNGSLVNGPTWVPRVNGTALSFNGTNYVQVPDSQSLNITGNQFSISAWVNPRAQANPFSDIVSKRSGLLTQYFLWENWNSTRRQVDFATGLYNGTNVYVSSPVFHQLNNWYQVTTVYNGTRLRLFVDGNLEIDQPVTGNLVHLNVPVTIGFTPSFNYHFNGTIDEVRIYNLALSQSGIAALLLRRTTNTTVTCSPSMLILNQHTSCTATVSDTSPGPVVTPPGSVSFTTNSSGTFSSGGSCTLSGSGASASCIVSYTPTVKGVHAVGGSYTGDLGHGSSSAILPFSNEAIVDASIGGVIIPVDKSAPLVLYIMMPTLILILTLALAVYVRRRTQRENER